MAHDVRSVANAVLDIAETMSIGVSNLALNKILYFLHAGYLHEHGFPLVSAKIEAWDHGPVYREIYHQFKKFGRNSIIGRAARLDPKTGTFVKVEITLNETELKFVTSHALDLLKLSPGKLVDMSHVQDGPWYIARFGNGRINPGVEITNELILDSATRQARH